MPLLIFRNALVTTSRQTYNATSGVSGPAAQRLIKQAAFFRPVHGAVYRTNPPIVLKEPMNLNRDNPKDFSLLERATLHYLGLERYDFKPAGPREANWIPAEAVAAG